MEDIVLNNSDFIDQMFLDNITYKDDMYALYFILYCIIKEDKFSKEHSLIIKKYSKKIFNVSIEKILNFLDYIMESSYNVEFFKALNQYKLLSKIFPEIQSIKKGISLLEEMSKYTKSSKFRYIALFYYTSFKNKRKIYLRWHENPNSKMIRFDRKLILLFRKIQNNSRWVISTLLRKHYLKGLILLYKSLISLDKSLVAHKGFMYIQDYYLIEKKHPNFVKDFFSKISFEHLKKLKIEKYNVDIFKFSTLNRILWQYDLEVEKIINLSEEKIKKYYSDNLLEIKSNYDTYYVR